MVAVSVSTLVLAPLAASASGARGAIHRAASQPKPYAPFSSWGTLVDRQFRDLTAKPPTTSEQSAWVSQLTAGTKTKGDLDHALRRGSENLTNVDPVVRVYRAFLGRAPDAGGLNYWIRRRRGALFVARMTVTQIAESFVASNEFKTKYGSLGNRAFVTRIYTDVLDRTADTQGVDYWTRRLDTKAKTRAQVMVGFSESSEYKRKQLENTDVSVAYIFLVGRAPTSSEAAAWVAQQKAGTGHAALLAGVLERKDYAERVLAGTPMMGASKLDAGDRQTCAILAGGTVRCWGMEGVTGSAAVPGLEGALDLSVNFLSSCVVMGDETARCWGDNTYRQLGDGTTAPRATPVTVAGLSGVKEVAASGIYNCALLTNGTVKCWGGLDSSAPVLISGATGVSKIAGGYGRTCVIKSGGAVMCWSSGNPSWEVAGLSGAVAIDVSHHSCAVLANGTVKCWGSNAYGQVGDGTTTDRDTPVSVPGLSSAVSIAVSSRHSCATLSSGSMKCWGSNANGELGDGTKDPHLTPNPVATISKVTSAGLGVGHSCAVSDAGAFGAGQVFCWGLAGFLGEPGRSYCYLTPTYFDY